MNGMNYMRQARMAGKRSVGMSSPKEAPPTFNMDLLTFYF